jgi:membrane protein YqaA with SNARE-associated domain
MHYTFEVIINYLFIQISILLFIAPFYLSYKYRHPGFSFKHLLTNEHIEKFFSSNQANWLIFFWAAAEATCWFIIPEFLLLLVIFLRVKNKRKLLAYDIAGTFIGTIIGLMLSIYTKFNVLIIPYITPNMAHQVQAWYTSFGSFGLLFQPFSGIPYKVFVQNAHYFHLNLFLFLLLAVVVRVARYYLFYLLFVGLFPFLHRFISRNYIPIFMISCFIFSLLFLKVYNSYGPTYVVDTKGIGDMGREILIIKNRF